MMNIPSALLYTESHEWVEKTGATTAKIGLTDYAQNQLGDLVFVNLPESGDNVDMGETFADVESVKAVSDIFSPITGTIATVNEELLDTPELLNKSPYEAWLIEVAEVSEWGELMDADAYTTFCEAL